MYTQQMPSLSRTQRASITSTFRQAVLDRLDGQTFVKEVGLSNGDFQNDDGQLKCFCPICQDRSKMSLVIDCETRRGHCTNLSCQGSNLNTEEGNLIELYALASSDDF